MEKLIVLIVALWCFGGVCALYAKEKELIASETLFGVVWEDFPCWIAVVILFVVFFFVLLFGWISFLITQIMKSEQIVVGSSEAVPTNENEFK